MDETVALIVAAGRGVRAGTGDVPKQYRPVGGIPVLRRTIARFLENRRVDRILVVIGPEEASRYESVAPKDERLLAPVAGGDTRQDSVRNGLAAVAARNPRCVLIHDAARPFVSALVVDRVLDALGTCAAVVPALPIPDTIKSVGSDGLVNATIPREGLHAAATPQGFHFAAILGAHQRAAAAGLAFTDDAGIAEWAEIAVRVVADEAGNGKLTTAADFATAELRLAGEAALRLGDLRVGTGYDVHAFGDGSSVMLGGIAIPHDRGIAAHSDGDVVLHALTDALLGALAEGDIGVHFPPSDPQWKGASSDRFLRFAAERVAARGGVIAHLDVAIIAEGPRVAAHREAMRARIAAISGIDIGRVAVKATTNEKLGFLGRGEGIAAIATATIRLPGGPLP